MGVYDGEVDVIRRILPALFVVGIAAGISSFIAVLIVRSRSGGAGNSVQVTIDGEMTEYRDVRSVWDESLPVRLKMRDGSIMILPPRATITYQKEKED